MCDFIALTPCCKLISFLHLIFTLTVNTNDENFHQVKDAEVRLCRKSKQRQIRLWSVSELLTEIDSPPYKGFKSCLSDDVANRDKARGA